MTFSAPVWTFEEIAMRRRYPFSLELIEEWYDKSPAFRSAIFSPDEGPGRRINLFTLEQWLEGIAEKDAEGNSGGLSADEILAKGRWHGFSHFGHRPVYYPFKQLYIAVRWADKLERPTTGARTLYRNRKKNGLWKATRKIEDKTFFRADLFDAWEKDYFIAAALRRTPDTGIEVSPTALSHIPIHHFSLSDLLRMIKDPEAYHLKGFLSHNGKKFIRESFPLWYAKFGRKILSEEEETHLSDVEQRKRYFERDYERRQNSLRLQREREEEVRHLKRTGQWRE